MVRVPEYGALPKSAVYTALNARWKYVYSAPDQRELLFDRQRDPLETRDLAGTPLQARTAQTDLKHQLFAFLKAHGEEQAFDGEDWRLYPRKQLPANPNAGIIYQDHPWSKETLFIPGYSD